VIREVLVLGSTSRWFWYIFASLSLLFWQFSTVLILSYSIYLTTALTFTTGLAHGISELEIAVLSHSSLFVKGILESSLESSSFQTWLIFLSL
jgi:hypothetical protein